MSKDDPQNPRYTIEPEDVRSIREVFLKARVRLSDLTDTEQHKWNDFGLRLATNGSIYLSHKQAVMLAQMILGKAPDLVLPDCFHELFRQTAAKRKK